MTTTTTIKPADPAVVDAEIAEAAAAENLLALEPDQAAIIMELRVVKAEVKRLEDRRDELSAEVKTMLRGYTGATLFGKLIASLKDRAGQRRVDPDKLRAEYPEAYAACMKQGLTQKVLTLHK